MTDVERRSAGGHSSVHESSIYPSLWPTSTALRTGAGK